MTDAGWESAWRALAERELAGSPLASLSPTRHDGLAIAPVSAPDDARGEGLADAPAARSIVVVTDRAADVVLASECDGLWWRGPTGAHASVLSEPRAAAQDEVPIERGVVFLTHAHEHGASAVSEVAVGLVTLLRARASRVAVAVGPELLIEIAKLRALRRLAPRVCDGGRIWIAARSAERSLARLDVATNAIRTTIGCAAAMIGGADVMGVLPMDASARGARLARNTGAILARESHLLAVDDAGRGSFAIEALTDRIARDAWELARELDRGGASAIRDRITRDADARRTAVASGQIPIVGVNKYALPSDACADPGPDDPRDAAPLEAARSRSAR
jgi:methylmalonyl-CoA mutase